MNLRPAGGLIAAGRLGGRALASSRGHTGR
jgi:hypothetical protein